MRTPVQPSTTTSPQPSPSSPLPSITLSGGVFEVLPNGTRRRIEGGRCPSRSRSTPCTIPNVAGGCQLARTAVIACQNVPDGRFVKITSVATENLTENRRRYQFCATNTTTRGDTELDVELFLSGAPVPLPTLSGQVYRMIDGQRVPVAGADVYFASRGIPPTRWRAPIPTAATVCVAFRRFCYG